MDVGRPINDDQATLWNSSYARAWLEVQGMLDRLFAPLEALLVQAVSAGSRGVVLDVGCGAGGTTLAVARVLGANGRAIGVDISEPLIVAARARAEREGATAEFIRADAQTHGFEPASVDMIISRFGVMFFDDSVQAFANLRRASRHGGELRALVWRGPAENPFMTTAERAAAPLLPNLPAREPDAPGQFAFADRERVNRILDASGWQGIEIRPVDVACVLPEKDLIGYFTRLGPLGRALEGADEQTRARVVDVVRPAFEAYVWGDDVRFDAACWMVSARATS